MQCLLNAHMSEKTMPTHLMPWLALACAGLLGAAISGVLHQGGNSTSNVGDVTTRMFRVERQFPYDGSDPLAEAARRIAADTELCEGYEIANVELSHIGRKVTFSALVRCP